MALTPKQKAFADYYIECGNATEAAKKAGYSEKTAYAIGNENLNKPEISEYISARMEEQTKNRASLSDRLKAGDSLMKRYMAGGYKYGETKREEDPLSKALREEAERMQNEDTE